MRFIWSEYRRRISRIQYVSGPTKDSAADPVDGDVAFERIEFLRHILESLVK
jgi:hypothetical protein